VQGFKTFVLILLWFILFCLWFYFCDGLCHTASYGLIFLKQSIAPVELIVTMAAIIIICLDISDMENQLRPKGIIRVLIIGIIFRKLTQLHLQRNPRRHLARLKKKKRFIVQTPLETVMNILNSLIERIPQDDVALEDLNAAIKIITKGTLYDAIDVND